MRIFMLLSLVFVGKTLALPTYKRQVRSISFSDDASVSAGLGGIGGKLKKNIGLKVPHSLSSIFGLSDDESDSNEIGLNIEGGLGLKPKLSLGGGDAGFGISLGGSGGLGIGMSGNNKKPSEKEHPNKHDKSKKHESAEESNSSGIWGSVSRIFGGNAESGHAGGKTSPDTDHKISTDLGDGISADVTDKKYNEHESKKQHYIEHNGSKGYRSSTSMNWTANKHSGENKNSYWNKGDVIVIPLSDEEKSDEDVDRNKNDNSHVKKSSQENKIKNSEKKREDGNNHVERGENIAISHGKDGQHSGSDKGHNNGNRNSSSHVKGDNETKEQKASKRTKTYKDSGRKEKTGNNYDKSGKPDDHAGSGNNDVKKENANHGNGKGVTNNESHGNENRNKNSTGHGGAVAVKESDTKKNNGLLCNYGEILSNGKCGSNIKSTLQLVQTFIRSFDTIVHFLLELKRSDLRKVLCQVLPHNSKLSCQLGCDVLRVRPFLKYF